MTVETGLPGIDESLGSAGILALPARGVFRGRSGDAQPTARREARAAPARVPAGSA